VTDLLALGAAGWPAVEQVRRDGWLLRASSGVTQRANSALGSGDLGVVEEF
jgi:N-acetylglutamate synthase